jgi:hypothetical protein
VYNVRDYGAVGNGSTLDDDAIDRAINAAAAAAGGGTVQFPAGTYQSRTIHLKSNVTLPTRRRVDDPGRGQRLRRGRAEPLVAVPGLRAQPLPQLADVGRRDQRTSRSRVAARSTGPG